MLSFMIRLCLDPCGSVQHFVDPNRDKRRKEDKGLNEEGEGKGENEGPHICGSSWKFVSCHTSLGYNKD